MTSKRKWTRIPLAAAKDTALSCGSLKVLLFIAGHVTDDGWSYTPQTTIAAELGCSRQYVCQRMRELGDLKYIVAEKTPKGVSPRNRYRIILPENDTDGGGRR